MSFIRNAWYMAAWATDLGAQCLPRRLLGEPVVLFRRADGKPVALFDRCPHRFAPLSKGTVHGDAVECLYHGLRFDGSGACVLNPHGDGRVPPGAQVRSFPVVERDGIVWIWMGEAAHADASAIPDFSFLTATDCRALTGTNTVAAHYELVVDNLLDLSHINFLHANYQRNDDLLKADHEIREDGDALISRRWMPGIAGPAFFRQHLEDKARPVDYWLRSRWDPPGAMALDVGVTYAGEPEEAGLRGRGVHIVTPADEKSTHYFYAMGRNFRLDDPKADASVREWQRVAFVEQDQPMLEAVQDRMGTTDLMSLKPVMIAPDALAVRARRILARLRIEDTAPRRQDKATA